MTKGAPRLSNHALRSLPAFGRSSAYVVAGSQCDPAGSRERTLVNAGVLRKPRGSKRLRRFVITRERSSLERLRSTFELSFAPFSRSRERRPRRPLSVPPLAVVRRAIAQVDAAVGRPMSGSERRIDRGSIPLSPESMSDRAVWRQGGTDRGRRGRSRGVGRPIARYIPSPRGSPWFDLGRRRYVSCDRTTDTP